MTDSDFFLLPSDLELGRLELRAPPPPADYRLPTILMSSRHLIIWPRVCNSPGGIFAIFLKIFFAESKLLPQRHKDTEFDTNFSKNTIFGRMWPPMNSDF